MGKLIYLMNVSLDGYVETPDHGLDWSVVDEELHTWFNDQLREVDASLYGRRRYEVMNSYWPTAEADPTATPAMLEFARIWNGKPKIVFSTTLARVEGNSRLVRGDVAAELSRLRTEFDGDLAVGGPTLASAFVRRGLVDEYRLVVHPTILGAATPFFPRLETPVPLHLTDSRTFASGATYLAYAADQQAHGMPRAAATRCRTHRLPRHRSRLVDADLRSRCRPRHLRVAPSLLAPLRAAQGSRISTP